MHRWTKILVDRSNKITKTNSEENFNDSLSESRDIILIITI